MQHSFRYGDTEYLLSTKDTTALDIFIAHEKVPLYKIQKPTQAPVTALNNFDEILLSGEKNGKIILYSFDTLSVILQLKHTHSQITALHLHNKKELIFTAEDGYIYICNLQIKTTKKLLCPFLHVSNISSLTDRYALIYDAHSVALLDMQTKKLLATKLLHFHRKITALKTAFLKLHVYFEDNTTHYFEIDTLLAAQDRQSHPLSHTQTPPLQQLQALLKEQRYPILLLLCQKHPSLQKTPYCAIAQQQWEKIYQQALQAFANKQEVLARELLEPFIIVPSKQLTIRTLFRYTQEYLLLHHSIRQHNYEVVAKLLVNNAQLATTPMVEEFFEALRETIQNIEQENDAKILLRHLRFITALRPLHTYIDRLKPLYKELIQLEKLLSYYKQEKFEACYEILDTQPLFLPVSLYPLLQNYWQRTITLCEKYAMQADISSLRKKLIPFLNVTTRKKKIDALFRYTYYKKIDYLLEEKQFIAAEKLIYTYIDLYEWDDTIHTMALNYTKRSGRKLAVTQHESYAQK